MKTKFFPETRGFTLTAESEAEQTLLKDLVKTNTLYHAQNIEYKLVALEFLPVTKE